MSPSIFRVKQDLFIILRDLGLLIPVVGLMAIISLVIPLTFGESYALAPLAITAAVSFALGAALYLPLRKVAGDTQLKHGLIIAAFGWLLVAALGAIPFTLTAIMADPSASSETLQYFRNPASAFFESISGYTGTGLTMAARADLLPKTLQWWRSFIEWIGGMGVIVLMLAILAGPRPGAASHSLYYAEARSERIHPSINSTLRTMWWIFFLYTFIAVISLWGAGMPMWESINHAMTAISTGGFSVTANSIASYDSVAIELVLMPIMMLGAISFAVHYEMMRGNGRILWRDFQTRWFILLTVIGIAALTLENLGVIGGFQSLRESAFQMVSSITCTGFQTADVAAWTPTGKLLLATAMFIGGAAGSTAGGIKVMRMLILMKGVQWRFRKIVSPRQAIVPFRLGTSIVDESKVGQRLEDASLITFLWFVFLGVGIIVLLHVVPPEYTLSDVVFEVASAQGNVGLSVGITHPTMSLAGKLILCFNMWIGRLEIIPVLMLVRALFFGVQ
ncbi:TrkH family potassium uptake protein [Candidatus Bipolaricaulota bacterium]|nr:TrkH family potassium uptake protein [Candidatus Bipolaricaulota bacterium]TFH11355.1 MAG: TrkH family potassium uptake protein [Candidatus Atribacteria bacterium]